MLPCRYILDIAGRGSWNMAVDEAVLEHTLANPAIGATLRWYRWQTPTLSLGYFQSHQDRPVALETLDCVRRLTGGGAILHHHELTYSLVIPAGRWPAASPKEMVLEFHRFVAVALANSCHATTHAGLPETAPQPFLCFLRRSQGDLVVGEHKVLGSAQRNRRGALLQHGSIIVSPSEHASVVEGLRGSVDERNFKDLAESVTAMLSTQWRFQMKPGALSAEELAEAKQLERDKYRAASWNERR